MKTLKLHPSSYYRNVNYLDGTAFTSTKPETVPEEPVKNNQNIVTIDALEELQQ
ncbi:18827_t:CDS:2 [Gigaspora margarita]|uniref:18827_t:CDS:1 n=1 Tax=Gigaspora margarita TaxID=4874 RepID=A0ABM8W7D3_GIGMA|nr:18827_t:CDS:2 [Gigaspora margarita]